MARYTAPRRALYPHWSQTVTGTARAASAHPSPPQQVSQVLLWPSSTECEGPSEKQQLIHAMASARLEKKRPVCSTVPAFCPIYSGGWVEGPLFSDIVRKYRLWDVWPQSPRRTSPPQQFFFFLSPRVIPQVALGKLSLSSSLDTRSIKTMALILPFCLFALFCF